MRTSLVQKLLCPRCYGFLALRKERASGDPDPQFFSLVPPPPPSGQEELVYEGKLTCKTCGIIYPIHQGVVSLAVLDREWASILNEMIARRMVREDALRSDGALAKREKARREQAAVHEEITERMTRNVLAEMDFKNSPSILDLGGGGGATAKAFAERGADVVLVEPELDDLFQMNLKGYENLTPQEEFVKPNGEKIFKKWPEAFDGYFARVFASGHRLPFVNAAFDVTFCRAVLHHVARLGPVLREMLRVTKPGGRIILCSEPNRSIFDGESWLLMCDMDAHRGLNERRPRLLNYLIPLRGRVRNVRIQYVPWGIGGNTFKIMNFLRWDYDKRLRSEEWLAGWRILKLLPVSSTINLIAERSSGQVTQPPLDGIRPPWAYADELVRMYSPAQPLRTVLETLSQGTEKLIQLRRKLLRYSTEPPMHIDLGSCERKGLNRGFGEPVQVGEHRARPTLRRASATLRKKPKHRRIGIFFVPLRSGAEYKVRVSVNGQPAAEFDVREPVEEWIEVWNIPQPVIDVAFENETLYPEKVADKEIESGIGVRWIRLD